VLNVDGSIDPSFGPAVFVGPDTLSSTFRVATTVVQPDGKIVVAGDFFSVNGVARTNIARLNVDGTLDLSFDAGAVPPKLAVALAGDGKLLVGGGFESTNGFPGGNV